MSEQIWKRSRASALFNIFIAFMSILCIALFLALIDWTDPVRMLAAFCIAIIILTGIALTVAKVRQKDQETESRRAAIVSQLPRLIGTNLNQLKATRLPGPIDIIKETRKGGRENIWIVDGTGKLYRQTELDIDFPPNLKK